MIYTKAQIKALNETARNWPTPPLVYQYVVQHYSAMPATTILDYGAGPKGKWSRWLNEKGFAAVPHDIGRNKVKGIDTDLLQYSYNIAVASNVLNVQPSLLHICRVLEELRTASKIVVLNYPLSPRHSDVTFDELVALCDLAFDCVSIISNYLIVGERTHGHAPSASN